MPRFITVEDDAVDLVLDALNEAASQRQRAAALAALELDRSEVKDKRPGSSAIAKALADAGRLLETARSVRNAESHDAGLAAYVDQANMPRPEPEDDLPTTPADLKADLASLGVASALDEDLEDEDGVIGASVLPPVPTAVRVPE